MSAPYYELVRQLRQAFPQPTSDRVHDAYFAFSFLRALDELDALKSERPLLGEPIELDYDRARTERVPDASSTLEAVTGRLVDQFRGMFIWGHPRSQINVVPYPTIAAVIGGLLPAIYNPNLCSEESARRIAEAEVRAVAATADLIGYDPAEAGGVFTFGGTGTLLYGVKLGLEKAIPGLGRSGHRERAVLICSERAHYACDTVANWLGLGEDNVIRVPDDERNEIRPCLAHTMARDALRDGARIAAIVATVGTTDAFGLDDVAALDEVRRELADEFQLDPPPHLHADAVIGWAWSAFEGYDFEANPLGFRPRTVRALAGIHRRVRELSRADSVGIDFHKTGFAPYVSSLFLVRRQDEFRRIARPKSRTPYLFQTGVYHPGQYTLETTRAGNGPLAALANLWLLGRTGMRALLGHLVTMAEVLREHLEGHAATTVLNRANFGPVTLFRVYPDGVDTFVVPERERRDPAMRESLLQHNEYNRRIFELMQQEALRGEGVVISLTDCYRRTDYGEPIVALKSFITSPFADEQYVDAVLESLWRARARLAAE
ncbi:MAG: aspartate aminotransferase family protein [Planctomycetota bacterium]|nr:MAG: aspartate aminotransferase family protein [Planctomycetota bacterium]